MSTEDTSNREYLIGVELVRVPTIVAQCPGCKSVVSSNDQETIENIGAGGTHTEECPGCSATLNLHRPQVIVRH